MTENKLIIGLADKLVKGAVILLLIYLLALFIRNIDEAYSGLNESEIADFNRAYEKTSDHITEPTSLKSVLVIMVLAGAVLALVMVFMPAYRSSIERAADYTGREFKLR